MMKPYLIILSFACALILSSNAYAKQAQVSSDLKNDLNQDIEPLMKKVIEWRHDIHQYPELSNREFRTSKKVEDHLRSLGQSRLAR